MYNNSSFNNHDLNAYNNEPPFDTRLSSKRGSTYGAGRLAENFPQDDSTQEVYSDAPGSPQEEQQKNTSFHTNDSIGQLHQKNDQNSSFDAPSTGRISYSGEKMVDGSAALSDKNFGDRTGTEFSDRLNDHTTDKPNLSARQSSGVSSSHTPSAVGAGAGATAAAAAAGTAGLAHHQASKDSNDSLGGDKSNKNTERPDLSARRSSGVSSSHTPSAIGAGAGAAGLVHQTSKDSSHSFSGGQFNNTERPDISARQSSGVSSSHTPSAVGAGAGAAAAAGTAGLAHHQASKDSNDSLGGDKSNKNTERPDLSARQSSGVSSSHTPSAVGAGAGATAAAAAAGTAGLAHHQASKDSNDSLGGDKSNKNTERPDLSARRSSGVSSSHTPSAIGAGAGAAGLVHQTSKDSSHSFSGGQFNNTERPDISARQSSGVSSSHTPSAVGAGAGAAAAAGTAGLAHHQASKDSNDSLGGDKSNKNTERPDLSARQSSGVSSSHTPSAAGVGAADHNNQASKDPSHDDKTSSRDIKTDIQKEPAVSGSHPTTDDPKEIGEHKETKPATGKNTNTSGNVPGLGTGALGTGAVESVIKDDSGINENTGRELEQEDAKAGKSDHKPSTGEKIKGKLEKVAGKLTGNPEKVAKGDDIAHGRTTA